MILVTVGTHHDPFTRLIRALDALPPDDLVVQHGHSPPPQRARERVPFLSFGELSARMAAADVVVTHAGVGSILLALRNGRVPLVVPRRRSEGEHVDDHQVELTEALAEHGDVVPVWDVAELPALVAAAPAPSAPQPPREGELHRAVRAALLA